LNAFQVLKQLLSKFLTELCLMKPLEQVTGNSNARAKLSKDSELTEMLGSKSCFGCMSRHHWHISRRLDLGHYTKRWDGAVRNIACVCA